MNSGRSWSSSSSICSRWSMETAPNRTPRRVAPLRASWSACSRNFSPCSRAARKIASAAARSKICGSTNPSQYSASFRRATSGIMEWTISSTYPPGSSRYSGGISCAPRNVGTSSSGVSSFQRSDHLEHFHFGFEVQAVSAFGLERGCPMHQKRPQSRKRPLNEIFSCRGPDLSDRAENSSAARGNFLVRASLDPLLEIVNAGPHEYRMGMAIHKSRHDHTAFG